MVMIEVPDIFFALNGVRPDHVIQKKLAGGLANAGVFLYELEVEGEKEKVVVSRILEKRTLKKQEVKVARKIREWASEDDKASHVFPAIFDMREGADYCSIYMEYLDGAGVRPRGESTSLTDAIVTSVLLLNRGLTKTDVQKPAQIILMNWEKRIEAARSRYGLTESGCNLIRAATPYLAKQPVFMGHNDLFWPNMAIDSKKESIRFLDFGLVGNNLAGAEFHHFFRYDLISKKSSDLFRAIIVKYSEMTGISRKRLSMASQCYALVRAYERIGRIDEKQGRDAFQREMSFIERVESRIHKKLETGIET